MSRFYLLLFQPKYWCKHCSIYVKDTPFERNQHESTGKHQGNLKRFLNGIQKNHARNEREKDQAKAEVDRLNRIAGASSSSDTPASLSAKPAAITASKKSSTNTLSAADQKRQWAQLAEMGIAVPESARADIALPGNWQTLSRKVVPEPADVVDDKLNIGVRKRKFEGEEEEEEAGEVVVRRGWGSTTKTYPGSTSTSDGLDSLLASSLFKKKKNVKQEEDTKQVPDIDIKEVVAPITGSEGVAAQINKGEEVDPLPSEEAKPDEPVSVADAPIKAQVSDEDLSRALREDKEVSTPVFKKRRPKNNPTSSIT